MEKNKENLWQWTYLIVIGIVVAIFVLMFCYSNRCTKNTYSLMALEQDVYAIYYQTHSRVPAENYDVVTLCCDGNVQTFEGDVFISYTNENPSVVVENYNIVHGDKIYVYVPQGTVNYSPGVNIR